MTTRALDQKLDQFLSSLTPMERDNYRDLLTRAAGDLAPRSEGEGADAFRAVQRSLHRFVPGDFLFRGRIPFMTEELLQSLREEAEAGRPAATYAERHRVGFGGPIADALAVSDELIEFVRQFAPGAISTGIASYVHYDYDGAGLDAHVDSDIFALNVLIMLRHDYSEEPSHLLIYPVDQPVQRLLLEPGETIIMDAAGLVHAREDMKAGERLSILTFGFQRPAGAP